MKKRNLLLATISGLALAASLPWPGIWLLAWVALAPLFVALRGAKPREAAFYGLIAGAIYFGIILFWLRLFGYLPWALVALAESIFVMLFAVMAARLLPQRTGWAGHVLVPAAWTAVQWLRSLGAFAFVWGSLAHTQANDLAIAQIGSITGPWGIEFLVCLFNLAVADLVIPVQNRRRIAPFAVATALVVAVWIGGAAAIRTGSEARPDVSIAIIQGNLTHEVNPGADYVASAFATYVRMTRQAASNKPDFIVWPETTIVSNITDPGWGTLLSQLAKETRANLVVGGYDPSGQPESYNSAFFYDRKGGKIGVYHKVQLVPYGEFVPLRDRLPLLKRYGIRNVDILPGKSHVLVNTEIGKIGASICFESLFPGICAGETRHGANALIVITNDSWFQRTQAARQHMMMSKLRAIETRRYVVRAAATGVSAIIDPYGQTISELDIYKRGIVRGRIAVSNDLTPYVRFGDYFAYACVLLTIIGIGFSQLARRRSS